jgi:hypothetical protein
MTTIETWFPNGGKRKLDYIMPVFKQLHWLPIESMIEFKVLLYCFKVLHALAPEYLLFLVGTSCHTRCGLKPFPRHKMYVVLFFETNSPPPFTSNMQKMSVLPSTYVCHGYLEVTLTGSALSVWARW